MGEQPEHDVLIVGAGLSGLCVAHFLAKINPGLDLVVLEKEARPGGSDSDISGRWIHRGMGSSWFSGQCRGKAERSCKTLNLEREIIRAPLKRFVRYVCLNGQLVVIAQSPGKILTGKFMSFRGKLRVLADLWKKPKPEEQSVAQWSEYRFGKGVLPLVDAAVTGTYAGDMERLSIDAAMPGVRQMELDVGSVNPRSHQNEKTEKKGRQDQAEHAFHDQLQAGHGNLGPFFGRKYDPSDHAEHTSNRNSQEGFRMGSGRRRTETSGPARSWRPWMSIRH